MGKEKGQGKTCPWEETLIQGGSLPGAIVQAREVYLFPLLGILLHLDLNVIRFVVS